MSSVRMPTLTELTSFDLAVACIFALFLARGAWIGLVRQLAAFLALVGIYLLAARYAVQFSPLAGQFVANPRLTFFISFAVIFLVAALVFTPIVLLYTAWTYWTFRKRLGTHHMPAPVAVK